MNRIEAVLNQIYCWRKKTLVMGVAALVTRRNKKREKAMELAR